MHETPDLILLCRYCSYLRAGTGREYTDEDVRGHTHLQILLQHAVQTGVVVPKP